jgi:hypothetical protein
MIGTADADGDAEIPTTPAIAEPAVSRSNPPLMTSFRLVRLAPGRTGPDAALGHAPRQVGSPPRR